MWPGAGAGSRPMSVEPRDADGDVAIILSVTLVKETRAKWTSAFGICSLTKDLESELSRNFCALLQGPCFTQKP
jgi:hypothetical protein